MSHSDLALSVRSLCKSYSIGAEKEQHSTLAETLLAAARSPFRRRERKSFDALKDVSFEIKKGEVVGIIGRNGAGKSTLLKILSRITEPTSGEIDLYGRVGSLLEVGTGFHPELTGRENIRLNGTILGLSKVEIRKQFDAIVNFAGIESFLDTPVKRYSSGMYVRLAFAVAAHLSSEILIVDEVLAVGDAEFQRKCLGKMKDVATSGRTVIFVSHHMQSVQVLCDLGVYLKEGQIDNIGPIAETIKRYVRDLESPELRKIDPRRRRGSAELRIERAFTSRRTFTCGEEKTIHFSIRRHLPYHGKIFVSAHIVNEIGAIVAQCDSRLVGVWADVTEEFSGRLNVRTPWLRPGEYRVDLFLCSAGIIDAFEGACPLIVTPLLPYPAPGNDEATANGVVFADFDYVIKDRTGSPEFS
jgi:lipopolysaccharide transport system ATP-binding protein